MSNPFHDIAEAERYQAMTPEEKAIDERREQERIEAIEERWLNRYALDEQDLY